MKIKTKEKPCIQNSEGCKVKVFKRNSLQPNVCSNSKCIIAFSKTDAGQKRIVKYFKNERKEKTKELNLKKPEVKRTEYLKALQDEVNKLSRMIDAKFGFINCIDCGKRMDNKIDAAHFHSRGSNSTISLNLHNVHSAMTQCNKFNPDHKSGYTKGLIERYGIAYLQMVEYLPLEFKSIKLSGLEVVQALKTTRALIRNFETYNFESSIQARNLCNKMINLYK